MHLSREALEATLGGAELIHDAAAVEAAYDRMAAEIRERIGASDPLVLCVMMGGLVPTAKLIARFDFPYRLDYLHATRYRGATRGGELHWLAEPTTPLAGETVLVVDDIFDEGLTLRAIVEHCRTAGAAQVLTAVLVNKRHERKHGMRVDFVGLDVPDRYVFGEGMDYQGYLRGLGGIRAIDGGH
ncbi:hypoxanthine-guanine phosphoribosyltransferase [Inmirania thermothiophila]|uniref:Hypoxanthine phosphoribosyltransferase n=1 Tax=Inmirania thermothiophila TaxID=1750597 RepID=A0A3N1Y188_9GAMM|nr:hypoxanthine-guanine phosphoribosyltransferase [Inmirania thermothiophila]ROR32311.1 hypoxanthine phosphoribosyltransferase [Inmirania thermothiophila]